MTTPDPYPITDAASVLLSRGPGSTEVYLVRRADNLRFFGGFVAFPGGKVGGDDAAVAKTYNLSRHHVAAVRELFEETGVLLARRSDGSFPPSGPDLYRTRHDLNAGRVAFADMLGSLDLSLRSEDLTFAGTLVTPPFSPIRFATGFFVAHLREGQHPDIWPGELAEGYWSDAGAAVDDWTRGGLFLSPPTVSLLEVLRGRPIEDLPERLCPLLATLEAGVIPPIWVGPGVRMLPLFSRGLPPALYTNAFLVGTEFPYLIDPGAVDVDEQQRLFVALDESLAGRRLAGVILTHYHSDHVGAAAACSARYNAPILAHAEAVRLLEGKVRVDRHLSHGDLIDLGPAPDGVGRWHLEAVHTPGHAPDHLAFWEPKYRRLFVGDMISTLSSVVIAPPEGDLSLYIDSLKLLQSYPARLLLPAHGFPSARPAFLLEESLSHRAKRELQLLEALAAGPRGLEEMSLELYRGLPPILKKFGDLQLLAGLQKLQREGLAVDEGQVWRLAER